MIFVTGDCHGDFRKFSTESFPEQKEMTKDDIVIVCGDFGAIWDCDGMSRFESYWLNWLDEKPFTTVFVDGNHENFDRLITEFEVVDFHDGKAHKLNNSVYHLMRGAVFDFEGKRFFAFGGARSHDIDDGILSWEDFDTMEEFKETVRIWKKQRKIFRINHVSWWKEELPSDEEIQNAEKNLAKVDYKVDYVITHCAPQSIVAFLYMSHSEPDKLTSYFEYLSHRLNFRNWFFGHYHEDKKVLDKYILLYDQIVRIL